MLHGTHNALPDERNADVLVYVNGELLPRADAKISVFDAGYLVGDGIWEGMRLYDGVLVFAEDHLDRLWRASKAVHMALPWTRAELTAEVMRTVAANDMHDGVHLRVMVTRGIKKTPSQDPRLTISGPNLVIIAEHKVADATTRERGVTLFTSTVRRGSPDYLDPRLNCHSKLHEVQALIQAIEAGADEALMLDIHGMVSTCNATNFFMVSGEEVWTSTGRYCMNGITRAKVIEVCERLGVPCYQRDFSLYDVYDADEAFVTGTFGGLTPVTKIDGRTIGAGQGSGPLTQKLSAGYQDLIAENVAAGQPQPKG